MLYYAKIINKNGKVDVGFGYNAEFYQDNGFEQMDVEQSDIDGDWYVADKCPHKSEEQKAQDRENEFKSKFFQIPAIESIFVGGWYRKTPKGYQSAVESLNSAFNIVNILGKLPANILQFYIEPDFTKPEECTEEWLVKHAFKNDEMSIQQFGAFYAEFLTAWNREEH